MIDVYCLSIGQKMDVGNYYHGLIIFESGNLGSLRSFPLYCGLDFSAAVPIRFLIPTMMVWRWRCVLCVIVSIIPTRELSNTACVITCNGPRL